MFYTVYKTTNLVDGGIYIGTHRTTNINDSYLGSGLVLKRAIKKYGRENFKKEILAVFDSAEAMFDLEARLVNEDTLPNLYNLIPGGEPAKGMNSNGSNIYENHSEIVAPALKAGRERVQWLLENDPDYPSKHAARLKPFHFQNGHKIWEGRKHTDKTKKAIGEKNSELVGEKNSQYGTCWITNDAGENKKINKSDPLPFGWRRGRTCQPKNR